MGDSWGTGWDWELTSGPVGWLQDGNPAAGVLTAASGRRCDVRMLTCPPIARPLAPTRVVGCRITRGDFVIVYSTALFPVESKARKR